MRFITVIGLLVSILAGCGSEGPYRLGPQTWGDFLVTIEAHPAPPRPGMNEFIVIVNEENGKPGFDLVVKLRMNSDGSWRQAIPDGNIGIYRRAMNVTNPEQDVLYVQLQNKKKESVVLEFPVMSGSLGVK